MTTCKTIEEVRKIKEECSLHYLSLTPEERDKENQEAREWFEKAIGRKIPAVDHSRSVRETAEEELAQV
ncbi:MAG: hypothetical protein LBC63_01050 [Holophagales bacterium]|jgi:hypothetical protein|nr:hypothetical protein [Holophagales bacterium]